MQQTIRVLLKKGILVSPEIQNKNLEEIKKRIILSKNNKPFIYDEKTHNTLGKLSYRDTPSQNPALEIMESFVENNTKITVKDFITLYNTRYTFLQSLLRHRQDMLGATTIRKIYSVQDREKVSFIAMVLDISLTRNNNYILNLEDQTGTIKAIVTKSKKELFEQARSISPDEVIGIQGNKGDKVVFVNNLVTPDIPLNKELKKSPEEGAAVFMSDLHFGSKAFLGKSLDKFIAWINGKTGTSQQKILVEKIKYLFIVGDLVEGIGIYPGQEKELVLKDLYEQYKEFSKFIMQISSNITIIICPGNHDSLRVAEPQPPLAREYVPELVDKENIFFVSNPAIIRIAANASFSGLDVLLYHGYSFPHYADKIEEIRLKGGLENTGSIMKHLLKKRHLAPTHGSTQYQPGYLKDPLVIKNPPDFFVSGHVHRSSVDTYRNITLLNCSCWVSQTPYQERRGLVPQPARAIYVDLKTRKTTVFNFLEK